MLTMTGDYCRRVSLFFFFQAEAGIRDIGVTGVQTCALPIWPSKPRCGSRTGRPSGCSRRSRPTASRTSRSSSSGAPVGVRTARHHGPVVPTQFASTHPLDADAVEGRLPRPSPPGSGPGVQPPTAAEAAASIGLETVGDLLRHLPRASGEARTIAELQMEEVATVLVEVRGITSRPVRRRGMKPLVEATVVDATGVMKATFFNQPWLERQYRPGTLLMLQGKYQGRNAFRVNAHARTDFVAADMADVATYPATKGIT